MTVRSPQYQAYTAQLRWKRMKAAVLGDLECDVGAVVLATPIKLPLHVFQQIIEEHRAGKKSRI